MVKMVLQTTHRIMNLNTGTWIDYLQFIIDDYKDGDNEPLDGDEA